MERTGGENNTDTSRTRLLPAFVLRLRVVYLYFKCTDYMDDIRVEIFLKHLPVMYSFTDSRSGVCRGRFVRPRRREPGAPQRRNVRRKVLGRFFGGIRGSSQVGGGGEAPDLHRSRRTYNGN